MLSHFWLSVTLWTVACKAPLSMGFPRQEYWNGLPFPPPGDLPDPGIEPASAVVPAWQADSLPLSHLGSPVKSPCVCSVPQSCVTLCDPVDWSPPGSSVCGILQARILEWVAMPFSRGSSWPRDRTRFLHCRQILYHLSHEEAPLKHLIDAN